MNNKLIVHCKTQAEYDKVIEKYPWGNKYVKPFYESAEYRIENNHTENCATTGWYKQQPEYQDHTFITAEDLLKEEKSFKEGVTYRVEGIEYGEWIIQIIKGKQIVLSANYDHNLWESMLPKKNILKEYAPGEHIDHFEFKNPKYFQEEENKIDKQARELGWSEDTNWNVKNGKVYKIDNKSLIKKTMNNVIEFAKNLTLTEDEKNLRKSGLQDENGNWTREATQIVVRLESQDLGYKDGVELTKKTGIDNDISALEAARLLAKYNTQLLDIATKYVAENKGK